MEATETTEQQTGEETGRELGAVHTFRSKGANHRVIREAAFSVFDAQGRMRVGNLDRVLSYDFAPTGVLELREGQDMRPDGPNGEEQDAISYLRSRPGFSFYFWEDGNEPDRPLPSEDSLIEKLLDAASNLDPDAVEEILALEQQTHKRPVIVKACEKALARIVTVRDELNRAVEDKERKAGVADDVAELAETAGEAT